MLGKFEQLPYALLGQLTIYKFYYVSFCFIALAQVNSTAFSRPIVYVIQMAMSIMPF